MVPKVPRVTGIITRKDLLPDALQERQLARLGNATSPQQVGGVIRVMCFCARLHQVANDGRCVVIGCRKKLPIPTAYIEGLPAVDCRVGGRVEVPCICGVSPWPASPVLM